MDSVPVSIPATNAVTFSSAFDPKYLGQFHPLVHEGTEAGFHRQNHHRNQTRGSHEDWVIEGY